jgi:hypothetical protein
LGEVSPFGRFFNLGRFVINLRNLFFKLIHEKKVCLWIEEQTVECSVSGESFIAFCSIGALLYLS